jgi:hypothetical protein
MSERTGASAVRWGLRWACVAALVALPACSGDLLDVDDSGVIVPADLDEAGPAAIPTLVNGVVGAYHEAMNGLTRYTALLTDEMIYSGTFPTRYQVDIRRIPSANLDLTEDLYVPLHRARFQADTIAFALEERLDDPDFADAELLLLQGIAIAKLYSGYTRIWLAELYCWSILTGMVPEGEPLLPDERMADAIAQLEEAEAIAGSIGLLPVQIAAVVGQARANLWLGNYPAAGGLAAAIPREFAYRAEYSSNNPDQYNAMYTFTWGDTQSIHWTVGDGTTAASNGERWPYFEQFIGLNLLRNRPPGFTTMSGTVPVVLQTLYNKRESDVLMASGIEAALIVAEAALRLGQPGLAEQLVNDLRSDYSFRATTQFGVAPPAGNLLTDISFTGDLQGDLLQIAAERGRELWLTGDRHVTARRLRRDPLVDIDLFPSKALVGAGDDVAFPIPDRELDNNPNLQSGDACPAGQSPGSWR